MNILQRVRFLQALSRHDHRNKAAPDVIESFSNLHGWLRSEQTLELVRAWRHSHFEAARQTLVRAEGCRRSTFVQLNNNTPYTLRRATCALKHGVWLVSASLHPSTLSKKLIGAFELSHLL